MSETLNRMMQMEEMPAALLTHFSRHVRYTLFVGRMEDNPAEWAWQMSVVWPDGSLDLCTSDQTFPSRDEAIQGGKMSLKLSSRAYPGASHRSRIICNDPTHRHRETGDEEPE